MTDNKFNFFSEIELKTELDKTGKLLAFKTGDIIVQPENI